ncbi:hypothetical protein [Cobetia sp. L2A1]|uniref:hypothetical protein n=1 Tax=Cobetia sp. L2A1 TaxID=2686360 RepID=UPI00131A962F|nr:hypothetical protein [Cobetia sp. L2A1]
MLALARWAMRGPLQSIVIALLAGLVPWLFWFSAAISALVTLRRGLVPAAPVFIAAALPAGWWWTQGDPVPLATVLLVTLMATLLRARVRWGEALIGASLTSALMVQLGIFLPPGGAGPLLESIRQNAPELDARLNDIAAQGVSTEQLAGLVIGGITGLVVMLAATACLALARSWQSGLYNPGGFRAEFHAFRLSSRETLVLAACGVLGVLLNVPAVLLLIWIPLLVAGIALVHGYIGLKGMSGLWLIGIYFLLLTAWPTILILLLLALIDVFADFRARLAGSHR